MSLSMISPISTYPTQMSLPFPASSAAAPAQFSRNSSGDSVNFSAAALASALVSANLNGDFAVQES